MFNSDIYPATSTSRGISKKKVGSVKWTSGKDTGLEKGKGEWMLRGVQHGVKMGVRAWKDDFRVPRAPRRGGCLTGPRG